MDIIELTAKEYGDLVGDKVPLFCRKEFLELNSNKVDKVHYLVGKDTKNRIALAIGEINREWKAPYSAPFANFIFLKKDISMECIWEFIIALNSYARDNNAKCINLYLPADFYCAQSNARFINALIGTGYRILFEDVNYSFDLCAIDIDNYISNIHYNARKNLRIALKSDLQFLKCESNAEKEEVYDIIVINRANRGFPLRMTKQQLMDTIQVVEHDFFLVKTGEKSIASAVVYRITDDIAQVVYWGDITDVGEFKPINFISYELIKYYKALNFRVLDIGISTEEGKPNYGLCNFKESIGCIPSVKCRYQIDF